MTSNTPHKTDFSEEEVRSFISMGKQLTSKPVLSMLISVIEEPRADPAWGSSENTAAREQLVSKIRGRMEYNYAGYLQCEFDDIPHKLNISLSLVDKGYKTEIDIPDMRYANDLYRKYIFIKDTAIAFWKQFCEEHPALYKEISDHCKGVDFTSLVIDAGNPTTMYFDPGSAKRVGIFCYYVDAYNRPFYKNTKGN